jgi:hypothetical protein
MNAQRILDWHLVTGEPHHPRAQIDVQGVQRRIL